MLKRVLQEAMPFTELPEGWRSPQVTLGGELPRSRNPALSQHCMGMSVGTIGDQKGKQSPQSPPLPTRAQLWDCLHVKLLSLW